MNYDWFRTLLHQALDDTGLSPHPLSIAETIELRNMNRVWIAYVSLGGERRVESFTTTAKLEWHWDATLSARNTTTEEDLLMQLLGRDGYYLVTERPWLRIDATLNATLPWDSPLPLPPADAWRRWVDEVSARSSQLLPIESERDRDGLKVRAGRSDPEARFCCAPDGNLALSSVHLSAWECIELPRRWDNPDREEDDSPEDDMADWAERVRLALQAWENCLQYLLPGKP